MTFRAESNKKLFCIVVWDGKFKRNICDDELTNSNAEAEGVFRSYSRISFQMPFRYGQ